MTTEKDILGKSMRCQWASRELSFARGLVKILLALLVACTAQLLFAAEIIKGPEAKAPGAENETPKELKDIGITEHLGATLDEKAQFIDENGATVHLGDFFKPGRPVILDLAYYGCPGLCSYHLNGVAEALKKSPLVPGQDYEFVVVSIDTTEKPELAKTKKANMTAAFGRVEAEKGWHFLTGDEKNIKALAEQVGFKYKWVEEEKQFAHASAAYIVTPEGKLSRYLKGIYFEPQTFKLALSEAKSGGISTIIDRLILFCYHYDAKSSKYGFAVMNFVRLAAAITAVLLLIFTVPYWLKSQR